MNRQHRRSGSRQPCVLQPLESRRLLAGDVSVSYDAASNTINIEGDKQNNFLFVTGNLGSGYTIVGVGGTTVNGEEFVQITPPGTPSIRANFDVDLGKGNDEIFFNDFAALAVDVETGQGNDAVDLLNVTVFNGLEIETGQGNDSVELDYVDIHQGLRIELGQGDDDLRFGNTGTGVTVFSGHTRIEGGPGDDQLRGRGNLHTKPGTRDIENF